MQWIVVDRETLERGLIVKAPYVVISIRDPGARRPRVRRGAGLRGVLALAFDDSEPAPAPEPSRGAPPDAARPLTALQAAEIWRFVAEHAGQIGAVVCQCEEGIRRAPAVAAALAEAFGEDPGEILAAADPNLHVLALMTAACSIGRNAAPCAQDPASPPSAA